MGTWVLFFAVVLLALPARATTEECPVLWESGPTTLPPSVAPQTPEAEWRLVYCPAIQYEHWRKPARITVQGRMGQGPWQDGVSHTIPGLSELAPDRPALEGENLPSGF